ncbi:acyl carrier protein [Amycolatopsis decaplanina]|uniref:Phosphopantetheine-binding protein n=1 Tax=Amycolatopsis decaplanina DSM 44594 TaxID=1284240 RepID=M2X272_9PSEU|nr:phosphopantetheine-binding protein [Amycolatopsis decaplanina]EME55081.1 phosphopantetheine-binding protein [Amycolatopsis decaplanina DSM 44594]
MTRPLTEERVHAAIRSALRGFATEPELASLDPGENLRTALELDSLDFLTFVERLSLDLGTRIEESDYGALTTMDSATGFLLSRG